MYRGPWYDRRRDTRWSDEGAEAGQKMVADKHGKGGGATDARRRPRRGEGREALLAAVARIVARSGIDGVTFRSVATEAGVSPGLATYHFPNREVMLEEALTWAVQEAIDTLALADADGSSLMQYAVDFVRDNPEEMTFQFEVIFHGRRSEPVGIHVRAMYESYFDAVQESLRRAGLAADRQTAKLVLAVMDGLAVQELVFDDRGDALATGTLFAAMLAALSETRTKASPA